MAIDKIFNDSNVDGIADNIFNAVNNSVSEVKQMQQRKAAENAQLVIQSLKKIDTDIREKFDNVTDVLEKRVSTIKDGRDGINGKDGRDGKDGRNGKDGLNGKQGLQGPKGQDGVDGVDGVSVSDAHIDFDGSLIIGLSDGKLLNVGEVVSQDLQERIKIVTSGGAGGSGSSGDVVGPSSATDNAISRFDGTTGKLVQNSVVTIGDTGNVSGVGTLSVSGNTIISTTDNTNAALRITQLGTGNALLVEDSTNPDASPFVIDANGKAVIGNTTAITTTESVTAQLQVHATNDSGAQSINIWGAAVPQLQINRAGSGGIGTYTALNSGNSIGKVTFGAADGTAFVRAAEILAVVDGTTGTNDMPGRLVFSTTADGASTPTERVRIDSAGRLRQFGDTILSNVNVLGASYDSVSFSVAGEEANPADLFFSPDGLKMYVTGSSGDDVNEYNLSTAWVVSSAVYSTVFSVSGQETTPSGIFFRADGTKMYVLGSTNDTVFQYTLSTPWSVATASYDSISFSVAAQEVSPSALFFKPNGLSMYVVGATGDAVYQYTLSTAWNVSTATFLQSFSVSGQESTPNGLSFTGDGSRMFVMGTTGDDVNVYNLTTPWDISTSAFVNVFSVSGQDTSPVGLYIKPDGTKMYMVGSTNDAVYQYTVPSIDIQLTGPTSVASLDVQQDLTVYGNVRGKLSSCTVDGTNEVGYKNIPQNSQSAAYTLVLADAGKHILHPSGDANARTYTIPANSSVAYPIGTAITFINMTSQVVTIAINTDTMYLSAAGTTGSRSLAQYGSATAIKITSTNWLISGSGLT